MKASREAQFVAMLPQLVRKEWERLYSRNGKHQWQKLSAHAHKIVARFKK